MYVRLLFIISFFLLIIGRGAIAWGQSSDYKVKYYSMAEGLSKREVFDVLQDSRGFLWVAIAGGLNRFDGYQFLDFDKIRVSAKGGSSLTRSGNEISSIENLGLSHFYVQYQNIPGILDLIHADSLTVRTIDLKQIFNGRDVLGFAKLNNTIGLAVLCLENEQFVLYQYNPINGQILGKVSFKWPGIKAGQLQKAQISCSSKDQVFVKTGGIPVICFDTDSGTSSSLTLPASSNYTLFQAVGAHELYYVTEQEEKLFKYHLITHTVLPVVLPPYFGKVEKIWTDQKHNIIVGAAANLYYSNLVLLPAGSDQIITLDFITNTEGKILQIRGEDFQEQIKATSYNGLYIFFKIKKSFNARLTMDIQYGGFGHVLRGMVEDGKGNLFIAEDGNSLYKLDLAKDSIVKTYKTSDQDLPTPGPVLMQGEKLWSIRSKSKYERQIYCLNTITDQFLFWDLPLGSFRIRDFILLDSVHILYFGYDGQADTTMFEIFNTTEQNWQSYPVDKPEKSIKVRRAFVETTNIIWLGTENSLMRLTVDQHKLEKVNYGSPEVPDPSFPVTSIAYQEPNLLLGTENGLWVYQPGTKKFIKHFSTETAKLSNNFIEGVLPIDQDHTFLSTRYGLNLLEMHTGNITRFYENDGLAHNEFNRFAYFKGSNDTYYFGGINGLSSISHSKLITIKMSMPVIVSRFYRYDNTSGKEINFYANLGDLKEVIIQPDDQYFGFDFMYPDFFEPPLNQFQTWLEGFSHTWQAPTHNSHLRYDRLKGGNYTLRLRVPSSSAKPTEIGIQVKSHFYQASWFIPALVFTCITLGWAILLFFKNKKRKKELVKTLMDQKIKDLEVAALRAQMNPHFIYNCLGSIQQFVTDNDPGSATRYLVNFARLIRLALHSSVDGRHSLQDEIDMLDHYLGLERLRFGEKFSYHIEVDPELDKEEIFFPPLLIQPFVENALVHGMKSKTKSGKINISFKQRENELNVTVADNGPGFSTDERAKDSSGHKSVGMTLTKKRLEILSSKESFSMTPIVGDNGVTEGTRVDIAIPIA